VLKLIIEDDEGRKTVVPFVRDEITIGRQEGNTIRLTERNVSRRHARLMKSRASVLIEDLGSSNGIRINGDRIAGQVQVGDGDLIQIGDYDLALQTEDSATVPFESARSQAPTGRLLAAPPPVEVTQPTLPVVEVPHAPDEDVHPVGGDDPLEPERHQSTAIIRVDHIETNRQRQMATLELAEAPRLVVLNSDLAGREFACTRTEMKIGRTDDNDVVLDHRSLSRTHCKLVREDNGEWRVIDLQSANGLMVNGEPYAQVTLRYGDVVELGHVKLQFIGPGEAVAAPPSTSSITQETGTIGSRAPLFAILGALAVIGIGGGGYAWWKNSNPVEPPKDPVVVNEPARPVAPPHLPPVVAAVPPEAVTEVPRPPNPELARKENAQKLSDARAAIEALNWVKAESLLKVCTLDNVIVPEAQQLLTQMGAEAGFPKALEEASRLLDAGNEEQARTLLESAKSTQLLSKRYAALEQRRAKLVAERGAKQKPVATPRSSNELAEALYSEASDLSKAKKPEAAIVRLERCIRDYPDFYSCYKLLGSMHAKISARDNSEPDLKKARRYYERFLELAPPGDPAVPTVRGYLAPPEKQESQQ
jgi:pSer/pThr/pTyr-binding forkhead associated (FHA) protein